jgi:hypothetical protein
MYKMYILWENKCTRKLDSKLEFKFESKRKESEIIKEK